MKPDFAIYRPRSIEFKGVNKINMWDVKVYTVTNKEVFQSRKTLQHIFDTLPAWLEQIGNTELPNYKKAFLIVHEAREGVWILLNWWTGGEMIQTKIFFSSYENPTAITTSPYGTNALLCVWELEIFAHERQAWINTILNGKPSFERYLKDILTTA
ncbi:hypothetical protein KIM67_13290 [Flagellimonas sp. 389]|uniref:hypothetical protein n=1 Tax=Flagellimonas sp. 389 TaxID=2835862 RepID=UPI001BD3D71C|nr:hypothetical protein [Flagellimonas sp. 389]MBS9463387.1 hypothetical protein [Flagellimonas sp. 389]